MFYCKKKNKDLHADHKNIFLSQFYDIYTVVFAVDSRIPRMNIKSNEEIIK
jgi:hypothetical protein